MMAIRLRKKTHGAHVQTSRTIDRRITPSLPLVASLKGILASLNPIERSIADVILEDPERIVVSPIAEVAARAKASVGSVVAFCRRVETSGFADFKIALARDLAQSAMPASDSAQSEHVLERVIRFHQQCLEEVLQLNTSLVVERVSQVLQKARHIELFSIGLSYPVAYTAFAKLQLLGLSAAALADAHLQLIAAAQLTSNDVAVGISAAGTTRETLECLDVSRQQGATVIGITNSMKSPIVELCHHVLYATPGEIKYFQAPLASRITQLAIIDTLFVALASKHRNQTAARLQRSGEALRSRR